MAGETTLRILLAEYFSGFAGNVPPVFID